MGTSIQKKFLFLTASIAALSLGTAAHSQSLPLYQTVDANNVDLVSGSYVWSFNEGSIGTGAAELGLLRYSPYTSSSQWDRYTFRRSGTAASPVYTVTVGGTTSEKFTGTGLNNVKGNGGTLTQVGPGTFVYKAAGGVSVTFDDPTGGDMQMPSTDLCGIYSTFSCGLPASSISYPDGRAISFTWDLYAMPAGDGGTNYAWRLAGIQNSFGYAIKFSYLDNSQSGSSPSANWSIRNKADFINLAVSGSPQKTVSYSYPTSGTVNFTDMSGQVWQITTTSIKKPMDTAPSFSIGGTPAAVTSVFKDGVTTSYARSVSGSTATTVVTDAAAHAVTYTANLNLSQITSVSQQLQIPGGSVTQTTSYQYDTYGRLTTVTHPETNSEVFTYDARGNVTQVTRNPKTGSGLTATSTTAGYDATCTYAAKCNKPNWTKDALNNETDYTYDNATGLVTSVTQPADANGVRPQIRYGYSALQAYFDNGWGSIAASGNPVSVLTSVSQCRSQAGATVSGTPGAGPFTLSGSAVCAGQSGETRTTVNYGPQTNGVGNNLLPVSVTAASGDNSLSATTSTAYDNVGNVVSTTGPLGANQTSVNFYDAGRRLIGTVNPDPDGAGARLPSAVKYTYNNNGALTQAQLGTVPTQSVTSFTSNFTEAYRSVLELDGFDRVKRSKVLAGTTAYAVSDQLYDNLGRPYCSIQYMDLSVVPANGPTGCSPQQTAGSYGPDRVSIASYDEIGRVKTVGDGVDTLISKTYTLNGQVASVKDGQNNLTSYAYDGFDRLSQTTMPVSTQGGNASDSYNYETYTYDANDHMLQYRRRDNNILTLAYDNLGRLVSRTPALGDVNAFTYNLLGWKTSIQRAADSTSVTYNFDALGRVTSEVQPFGTISSQYDVAGNRTRVTWADNFYVTYDYDALGLTTAIREYGASSGVGVLATYAYDNLGRRTSATFGNGTGRAYAYDPVGRLAGLQLTYPNTANNQLIGGVGGQGASIQYAPSSQISSIGKSNDAYAWTGAYNVDRAYVPNGLNQYTSSGGVSLGYDAKGNLTSSGSDTFGYDKLNRLVAKGSVSLSYDPASRLFKYTTGSGTINSYYDGANLIAETSGGVVVNRYVPGPGTDEPVIWYVGADTSQRRFLQADERGSIVAVTDGAGAMLGINTYDEFGIPGSANIGRFAYTGQTWYPELGLYNYKARWYSPSLGRFMQTDPIGYGDGLNWYNYAHGDPVNGSDPSGLADPPSNDDPNTIVVVGRRWSYLPNNYLTWLALQNMEDMGIDKLPSVFSAPAPKPQSETDCQGTGFWNDLASAAETTADYAGAGALGAAGLGLALAPTGVGFAGAEVTAAGLGLVATVSNGVAAGANYMAGNNGRAAVNIAGMIGGKLIGGMAERGAARYMASSRMFGNLSAGQTRKAAYAGNFASGFAGDGTKGAIGAICRSIPGK